jgi:hypothetical protein
MRYVGLEKLLGDKIHEVEDTFGRLSAACAEVNRDKVELSCLTQDVNNSGARSNYALDV